MSITGSGTSMVSVQGGTGGAGTAGLSGQGGAGSGGGIRLSARIVELSGANLLDARGGSVPSSSNTGGGGRIALFATNFADYSSSSNIFLVAGGGSFGGSPGVVTLMVPEPAWLGLLVLGFLTRLRWNYAP